MRNISVYDIIRNMKINDKTKKLFIKLYLMFYQEVEFGNYKNVHSWSYSVNYLSLGFLDRLKFFTEFNISAFFFGPLYYIYKKIYLKGFILTAVLFLIFALGGMVSIFWPVVFLYCALFANKDYFLKEIKTNKRIKADPDILNGLADEMEFDRILDDESSAVVTFFLSIILSLLLLFSVGKNFYVNYQYNKILSNSFACSSSEICTSTFDRIGREEPKTSEEYYYMALAYFEDRNYEKASEYAQKSINLNPYFLEAQILGANIYFELGNNNNGYNKAIIEYKSILKKNPKLIKLNYSIGRSYYRLKEYKDAIKYLSLAVKKYPINPEYREVLAYSYLSDRNGTSARKHLKAAIKIYTCTLTSTGQKRKNALKSYYKSVFGVEYK